MFGVTEVRKPIRRKWWQVCARGTEEKGLSDSWCCFVTGDLTGFFFSPLLFSLLCLEKTFFYFFLVLFFLPFSQLVLGPGPGEPLSSPNTSSLELAHRLCVGRCGLQNHCRLEKRATKAGTEEVIRKSACKLSRSSTPWGFSGCLKKKWDVLLCVTEPKFFGYKQNRKILSGAERFLYSVGPMFRTAKISEKPKQWQAQPWTIKCADKMKKDHIKRIHTYFCIKIVSQLTN